MKNIVLAFMASLVTSNAFAAATYECKFDSNRSIIVTVDELSHTLRFDDRYNGQITGQSSAVFNPIVNSLGKTTELYSGTEILLQIETSSSNSRITFFKDLWFINPTGKTLNCLNN